MASICSSYIWSADGHIAISLTNDNGTSSRTLADNASNSAVTTALHYTLRLTHCALPSTRSISGQNVVLVVAWGCLALAECSSISLPKKSLASTEAHCHSGCPSLVTGWRRCAEKNSSLLFLLWSPNCHCLFLSLFIFPTQLTLWTGFSICIRRKLVSQCVCVCADQWSKCPLAHPHYWALMHWPICGHQCSLIGNRWSTAADQKWKRLALSHQQSQHQWGHRQQHSGSSHIDDQLTICSLVMSSHLLSHSCSISHSIEWCVCLI